MYALHAIYQCTIACMSIANVIEVCESVSFMTCMQENSNLAGSYHGM